VEENKQCPFCGEDIKAIARICRFCLTDIGSTNRDQQGSFVAVRVKIKEQTYTGDIFVPSYMSRLSDVINDRRHFITLTNAFEDTGMREVPIGFLAINKSQVERIELKAQENRTEKEMVSRIIEWT
jgi:hypothetical protein